jgi:hypothetical protein
LPVRIFSASVTCQFETMETTGPSTPAVSHVGFMPGGGACSKMQRKQGVALPASSHGAGATGGEDAPAREWGRIA